MKGRRGKGGHTHEVVNFLQFAHADGFEGGVDETAPEEIDRFARVLAVADVGSFDCFHADDRFEDGGAQVGPGGEADRDDRASWADVLRRLLEGFLVDGHEDDSMGAGAVFRRGLDVLDDVLRGGEVDKGLRAELGGHLLLLVARVDGDDLQPHRLRVLAGEGAEAAPGADDGDRLAGAGSGFFETFVDGDAGAEDGRDGVQGDFFGDAGDVGGFGNAVFLERTVDCVARQKGFAAEGLVAGLAEVAGEAGAVQPLDETLSVSSLGVSG